MLRLTVQTVGERQRRDRRGPTGLPQHRLLGCRQDDLLTVRAPHDAFAFLGKATSLAARSLTNRRSTSLFTALYP